MTLIKSLLLGSAAGLVAVSAAQAADLPTRKGPVAAEYVRVCSITVAGVPVVGFVLPGSDTCLRISGFVSAQVEAGNLKTGYNVNYTGVGAPPGNVSNQFRTGTYNRDAYGYSTRFNLTLDAVSNTAYGPLVAHGEYQFNQSFGFETLGTGGSDGSGINKAYVTWAGLTAGKAASFFAFTGGGFGYYNFFSPDRQGFNEPDLVAYTASFGGGFAATISIESPLVVGSGTLGYLGSATQGGARIPDIVGALSYNGAWGRAQVSGKYHDVRAQETAAQYAGAGGLPRLQRAGWAVDAGVEFNIPSIKGAKIGVTGAYSQSDIVASGLPDGFWDGATVHGNGQSLALADAFANPDGTWATPKAWTITGYASAPISSTVTLSLEGSYGQLDWSGKNFASLLSNSKAFLVGGVINYDPVKNLDFQLELFYVNTRTDVPTGYGASLAPGTTSSWQSRADGFSGRLFVTRSF